MWRVDSIESGGCSIEGRRGGQVDRNVYPVAVTRVNEWWLLLVVCLGHLSRIRIGAQRAL